MRNFYIKLASIYKFLASWHLFLNTLKAVSLTVLALIAFAANSFLNRMALGGSFIDAASFSSIRMISGALGLYIIMLVTKRSALVLGGSRKGSLALVIYMVTFSYAYVNIDTGTGAFVLFVTVQMAMVVFTLASGRRLNKGEWAGFVLALIGFLIFALPGVDSPAISALILMIIAGSAWAAYTWLGLASNDPVSDTAGNFIRGVPLVIILSIVTITGIELTARGIILASLSGLLASGFGYTVWYYALRLISPVPAAMAQLLVPILATFAGVAFLSESLSSRMLVASIIITGGILVNILSKPRATGGV